MRLFALSLTITIATILSAFAQSTKIDSLNRVLSSSKSDTNKITLLITLSNELPNQDSSSFIYIKQAYDLAKRVSSESHIARAEASLGLYYKRIRKDSASVLIKSAINRYEESGLSNKLSDVYWNLGFHFESNTNYDSAIFFFRKSLLEAEKTDYFFGIGEASFSLGNIYNLQGDNTQALKYAFQAKENFEQSKKQNLVAQALNQIGIIYDYMGLYPEALENYLKARDLNVELKNVKGEVLVLNNLGVIYDNMGNTDLAKSYYEEAREKSRIIGLREDEATLLNNLSYIYLADGDTALALSSLQKALSISNTIGYQCFDIYPLEGLASLYSDLNELDSAEYYFERTLKEFETCQDVAVMSSTYLNYGGLFKKIGDLKKSKNALRKSLSLAEEAKLGSNMVDALLALYEVSKLEKNMSAALSFLEQYKTINDSIETNKKIEKANQLAAEYEFRKEMEELKNEKIASEAQLEERLKTEGIIRSYILIAVGLLVLFILTLTRSYYAIQKRNKKLIWLNEEKNTLMGVVAHDLRNPLNMIKGLLQVITGIKTESGESKESDQYLHLFKLSTQKMSDMIDKVLDISAIENMKVNLDLRKENLIKLVNQSVRNFEEIAAKKEIEIQKEFNGIESMISEIDANYFDQIMDNLISNAIKFSNSNSTIYIGTKIDDENNYISVRDEGQGISEDDQQELFKKYKKTSAKPTSSEQSTGLGLSIVKKFVSAMNGDIICDSELGKGTTFTLKLRTA